MEQINRIIQLNQDGVGIREIANRTGISRNSVKKYLRKHTGTTNEVDSTTPTEDPLGATDALRRAVLNKHFQYAEKELRKTGVTRQLLWTEYKDAHPDGYNYSQYCFHFQNHLKHTDLVMHMEYEAGDMIMIDFAGKKLSYQNENGERVACEVFIAILPHSGLIYCKAVRSQKTLDFADCINSMLKYYGGVPKTILCDNLKTAVTRACCYEPVFADVCYQLNEHYTTTFSATRPHSPRDKGMVERAVSIVYNHIYGPIRNLEHKNLKELNESIGVKLQDLNERLYKDLGCSRWARFAQHEQCTLKALPPEVFCLKKMVIVTVQRNYHIQLTEDKLYYSVPHQYAGKKVKVLYDNHVVEVYCDYQRIAIHKRAAGGKAYTTREEHMPPHHVHMREVNGWTRESLLKQARKIGEYTERAASHMLGNSIYMEQNYKACFGMLMLVKNYTSTRVEAACRRVAGSGRINYSMIKNILKSGLDKQPMLFDNHKIPNHENIRGANHYN
jgi:transposase